MLESVEGAIPEIDADAGNKWFLCCAEPQFSLLFSRLYINNLHKARKPFIFKVVGICLNHGFL